jgi:uncharacterized MAPEG superfamily protein
MTTDLQMLVYSSLLLVAQSISVLIPGVLTAGLGWGFGNRDQAPTLPAWGERAGRAQRNMLENLIPFAALVLAAHAAGVAGEETARGATLFFWGRLAHAAIYIAGIPYLRTVAFVVAIGGMFDIARALLA